MKSNLDLARDLATKAANDLKMAEIGIAHDAPLDTVAFHVQQTAEKLVKAMLASAGVDYPRTHDLEALLDLAVPRWSVLETFRDPLLGLSSYAVDMRYDAALYPSEEEVKTGLDAVRKLRDAVVDLLPVEARP
jgi:HEPN domain-containing protein